MRVSAWLLLVLTLTLRLPAAAQSIHGTLLDDGTRQPIVTGEVALLWGESGNHAVFTATTDSTGTFLLRARQPGWYRLRARRIGYEEVVSPPISVAGDQAMQVELVMAASAVPLAPLTVLARGAPAGNLRLVMSGFYERRKTWGREGLNLGYFLDGADLNKHNNARVTHVVQEVPGVHLVGCGGRALCVTMMAVTRIIEPVTLESAGRQQVGAIGKGECTPSFYLDGQLLKIKNESIDDIISGWDLAAVEVYRSINRPPRFANMVDEPCGAIVLWTGGRDEARDTTAEHKH